MTSADYDLAAWTPRGWQILHLSDEHLERAELFNGAYDPQGPWRLVEDFGTITFFERRVEDTSSGGGGF